MKYIKSNTLLERAKKVIPLGSQTFSKSSLAYPLGVSPLFAESGKGCMITDVDGNEFIDFVNGLLCVTLGYQDTDIDHAVVEQIKSGVTLSLPHKLETEVAEMLVDLIPCAEMVRFGKNGSDSTSAAIRLARAYTGKEHIATCGYHGWHDWYIGSTTRSLGVPEAVKELTHGFPFNNIESLQALFSQHGHQLAAIIMEPMNIEFPREGYLQQVRQLCDQYRVLMIFDETITGFRFHSGGAQSLFEVTPDLATFGKGMANGYPLSAVVGKSVIMKLMEDIFYSGTFGGETLSLAAAKATISKVLKTDVTEQLHQRGSQLQTGLKGIIEQHRLEEYFTISGHPAWTFLNLTQTGSFSANQVTSLMQQEMHELGMLVNCTHNLSLAHTAEHIDALLSAYSTILPMVVDAISENTVLKKLKGAATRPIFKVR